MSYPPEGWNEAKGMYGRIIKSAVQWADQFTWTVFRCVIFKFSFFQIKIYFASLFLVHLPLPLHPANARIR